jgi:AraC-like DNA-binding protein
MAPAIPEDDRAEPSYVEVPPPAALADWVLSFWEIHLPNLTTPAQVRIVPNACVDLVLYVSEPSRGDGIAAIVAPPHRSYVVGSTLRSFIVRSVGWRHVIGASLRPAGVEPLLGLPAAVIGESVALLRDVIGRQADEIEDRILSGPPDTAMRRMAAVLQRWHGTLEAPDAVSHRAERLVRQASGRARIDALAGDLNISARRLERHFLAHVGMTPKLFSRLVRFDRAVRDLNRRGTTSWSQFALAHGYSDQAHFINEFREFAGVTPTELEAENRGLGPSAT